MAKEIPFRQCMGCRQMKPKNELVRIIRTPENTICLDRTGKMNGRGAYICLNEDCLKKAGKTRSISKALKMEVPDELLKAVSEELI